MKKTLFFAFLVLALLVSMLPMQSAFAAKVGTTPLNIRNKTGGIIDLYMINTVTGAKKYVTFSSNTYNTTITSGIYSYSATTACGPKHGTVNLTRDAQLLFSCNAKAGERLFTAHSR